MQESKLESIDEPLRTLTRQLISRCERAGIDYELKRFLGEEYHLQIYLPSGREKREIWVWSLTDAQKISDSEFEKYVFVQGYQAICSYEYGSIEAYIKLFGGKRPQLIKLIFRRLLNIPYNKELITEDLVFKVEHKIDDGNPIIITISPPTNNISVLTERRPDEGSGITIKMEGLKISNNAEATANLQKLANSFFFQILNAIGIPMMLEPYYGELRTYGRIPIVRRRAKKSLIAFPKYQYDTAPLNLYWCAASAFEMPLLRFLVYYQVLEFYFPIYSRKEAQIEVANILKDPGFNPDYPLDIGRVISAVSKTVRGYGEERSQLRSTIRGCTQDKEVRELIDSSDLKSHFRADYKKLSPVKISIDNKDLDLRDQLAERLYDLRCKIVHTKAEETQKERILPFTEEEALLTVELEIIEFIARKALIANSKKLSI